MNYELIIGAVALAFSITCFGFFVMDTLRRSKPEEIVKRAHEKAREADDTREAFNPAVLAAFAKPLVEAFTKAAPGMVALIGSLLFLLLAGEATHVYNLTGGAEDNVSTTNAGADDDTADTGNSSVDQNQAVIGDDNSTEPASTAS